MYQGRYKFLCIRGGTNQCIRDGTNQGRYESLCIRGSTNQCIRGGTNHCVRLIDTSMNRDTFPAIRIIFNNRFRQSHGRYKSPCIRGGTNHCVLGAAQITVY